MKTLDIFKNYIIILIVILMSLYVSVEGRKDIVF